MITIIYQCFAVCKRINLFVLLKIKNTQIKFFSYIKVFLFNSGSGKIFFKLQYPLGSTITLYLHILHYTTGVDSVVVDWYHFIS